jgi:uncharacterized membrane protein
MKKSEDPSVMEAAEAMFRSEKRKAYLKLVADVFMSVVYILLFTLGVTGLLYLMFIGSFMVVAQFFTAWTILFHTWMVYTAAGLLSAAIVASLSFLKQKAIDGINYFSSLFKASNTPVAEFV